MANLENIADIEGLINPAKNGIIPVTARNELTMIEKETTTSRSKAEDAVRALIGWAGDDVTRPGLVDTPERVVNAFEEWFAGYKIDPAELLNKSFDEVEGYHAPVMLKNIPFHSHCEHHLAPIIGKATIAYIPDKKVVGISKLARVTEAFALRLQIQERLTAQIAECLQNTLNTQGAAVMIDAEHHCMTTRGVRLHDAEMVTYHFTGVYKDDSNLRREFFDFCK
ncbi:MAG: GTP cyclohydrolase I FolE [Pseudomonadota bacterium]